MRFFFDMLYQATVNARCLYIRKYADAATKKKSAVVRTDCYRLFALVSRTTKQLMWVHPAIGRYATIIGYIYA